MFSNAVLNLSRKKLSVYSFYFSLLLLLNACSNGVAHETCGGQPTCPPPLEANASPELTKLRADLSGKWKVSGITTRDTFHKTEQRYPKLRFNMCISYDGGILFFQNGKELVCQYCYTLKNGEDNAQEIVLDETGLSPFCLQQLQSSKVKIAGDSMVLVRRDSFVYKTAVYRRMNDDGTFKVEE
jgi:hypothetical protein